MAKACFCARSTCGKASAGESYVRFTQKKQKKDELEENLAKPKDGKSAEDKEVAPFAGLHLCVGPAL
ncbi:hypothetical protein ACOMHN_004910 [Nucella lapillus]